MTGQAFTAELTPEQVQKGEDINRANGWIRRAGLMVLTQEQDELAAAIRADDEGAEAMMHLAESLTTYLERQSHEADLLKSARARLFLVLGDEAERLEMEGGR